VNLRYARDLRGEEKDIERVLVPVEALAGSIEGLPQQRSATTAQVPLEELADVRPAYPLSGYLSAVAESTAKDG
jgi:hypothetical protein